MKSRIDQQTYVLQGDTGATATGDTGTVGRQIVRSWRGMSEILVLRRFLLNLVGDLYPGFLFSILFLVQMAYHITGNSMHA